MARCFIKYIRNSVSSLNVLSNNKLEIHLAHFHFVMIEDTVLYLIVKKLLIYTWAQTTSNIGHLFHREDKDELHIVCYV